MTSSPQISNPRTQCWTWSTVLYVVLFAVFAVLAIRSPHDEKLGPIFVSLIVGSAMAIYWVWVHSKREKTDDLSLRNIIFCGMVIDVALNFAATKITGTNDSSIPASICKGIGNLGVLAAAVGIGLFLGRGMKTPRYLVLAAVVAPVADIISVYLGPSKHINLSEAFDYMSFKWGVIGMGEVGSIVGAGDFIFLVLYFYGSRKFGLDDRKTLVAMMIAIAVGFTVPLFANAVPALPFMSAAFFLVHGKELKRQIKELSVSPWD